MRVIQHIDWQVWDGNCSRSSECNQQHQQAFTFLQRQVQLVCVFFTEQRQVDGTSAKRNKITQCAVRKLKSKLSLGGHKAKSYQTSVATIVFFLHFYTYWASCLQHIINSRQFGTGSNGSKHSVSILIKTPFSSWNSAAFKHGHSKYYTFKEKTGRSFVPPHEVIFLSSIFVPHCNVHVASLFIIQVEIKLFSPLRV